jgi:hypothetical protein
MGWAAVEVGFADDGKATDVPALSKNEVAVESPRDANGIIAVLIGLQAPE